MDGSMGEVYASFLKGLVCLAVFLIIAALGIGIFLGWLIF